MNKNLNVKNPSDEFYTTEESAGYLFQTVNLDDFANKVVYCNCDGPESEIYKWLKKRYSELKLKSLYATKLVRGGRGVKTTFDGKQEVVSELAGDGDCFSDECKKLLDECDVVCTNPPFSKLTDFIPMLFDYKKDFVIISNLIVITKPQIRKEILGKKINQCGKLGAYSFVHNDEIVMTNAVGLTTLKSNVQMKYLGLTTEEVKKLGKLNKVDGTGEYEVQYVRYVPIDLEGTCLAPVGAVLWPQIKERFEFKDVTGCAKVNGKARFWRVRIMKKEDRQYEDLLYDGSGTF